jgi:hypothetical protein
MPSSIVVHMQTGWIGSSFVNLHPSPSVMLHSKHDSYAPIIKTQHLQQLL